MKNNRFSGICLLCLVLAVLFGCEEENTVQSELNSGINVSVEPAKSLQNNIEQSLPQDSGADKADDISNNNVANNSLNENKAVDEPNVVPGPNEPQEPSQRPADEPNRVEPFNSVLSDIFKDYVEENGLVDYAKLRRQRLNLNAAVSEFAILSSDEYESWNQNEKIAFWINAYNIFTLKTVIDNYPIEASRFKLLFYPAQSIMHIRGFWTDYYYNVMGTEYTLREIEKNILLGGFDEPRVCFALSYASVSGASLRNEPYQGDKLDRQLDEQARAFFAKKTSFELDKASKLLKISNIFKWYERSFLKYYSTDKNFRIHPPIIRAALNYLQNYISDEDRQYLLTKNYNVEFIKYDWTLDEQN